MTIPKNSSFSMWPRAHFYEIAQNLRNKLLRWRHNHVNKIPEEIKRFEELALRSKIDPRLIEVSKPLTRFISTDEQLDTLNKGVLHTNNMLISTKYFEPEAFVLRSVSALLDSGKPPAMKDVADDINERARRAMGRIL